MLIDHTLPRLPYIDQPIEYRCSLTSQHTLADLQRLIEQMREGIEIDMELPDSAGNTFSVPALSQFMLAPEDTENTETSDNEELTLLLNETRNIIERYAHEVEYGIQEKIGAD